MTKEATERSYAPLTTDHLDRLARIADQDHEHFTRPEGRPEYRSRRVCVALAQGAALHYLDGRTGIKDIDLWTFYADVPGQRFSFGQRKRHVDFGKSEHGRNLYARDFEHPQLRRWLRFNGRRVDLMIRSLPVLPQASADAVAGALHRWLVAGTQLRQSAPDDAMPSNWWLAQKAVVLLHPAPERGRVVWPAE